MNPKLVDKLGKFPLPVEVIPYGSPTIDAYFDEKGSNLFCVQTETGEVLTTDGGHYIIDPHLDVH